MFIGHNAVGFASKSFAPRTSMGWLMAAPMLLDLLWPIFLLAGLEHVQVHPDAQNQFLHFEFVSYPLSHSLLLAVIWGAIFGGIYFWRTKYVAGSVVLCIGVISHWVLDWVTHVPDLPLFPGGAKFGLGLWLHPLPTMIIEIAMLLAGVMMYVRATRSLDRTGSVALWVLVAALLAGYLAASNAPPPTSLAQLAFGSLSMIVIPFWAAWIDRHREARS